ncbi:hypothetical protein [Parasulfitobacter algicola]|uniref:Uncharacterized protein n=1 Tax=Parasulfitobacter algicola TaxID=2614809 RepID=A0ABX2IW66_9RHOB|nr:hypothetical protein [Sulfitobacter algicola]NSX56790.1 hypothetical protein [Sulfitobacter algicola]
MPIKKSYSLITIEGVRELIQSDQDFRCRYDLVGYAKDGRPSYNCVYIAPDGSEAILIATRASVGGVEPRKFNIWSGLFAHHFEFGDGTDLSFNKNYLVRTGDVQGRNEINK